MYLELLLVNLRRRCGCLAIDNPSGVAAHVLIGALAAPSVGAVRRHILRSNPLPCGAHIADYFAAYAVAVLIV